MGLTDYKVIGLSAPDLTEAEFVAILQKAGSPALSAASAVWHYCRRRGVSCAFLLAMFRAESSFGLRGTATQTHSWGNTRVPSFGGVQEMGTVPGRSGVFPVFRDWVDGGISTAARWLDHAPYQGKTTVRAILPVWAPPSDGNDTERYITSVLAAIEGWGGTGGTVALSKPATISKPSPNHGYPGDYKPEAVVWHITAGTGASALSWLTNPASNASANYVITEDGKIYELVNPETGQQGAAWANGDVQKPNLANPLIAGWVKAGINPNRRCVSIEHAGQSSMGKGGSLTPAQIKATVALTAWLCQRFGIAPDRQHIMPHAWINSVTRPNCPGFSETEWTTWIDAIAEVVRGVPAPAPIDRGFPGALTPAGGLVLNGQTPPDPGVLVCVEAVEATGRNAEGKHYSIKWQGHKWGEWRRVG